MHWWTRTPAWVAELRREIAKRLDAIEAQEAAIMSALTDLQGAVEANSVAVTAAAAASTEAVTMLNTLADTTALEALVTTLTTSTATLQASTEAVKAAIVAVTPPA